MLMEASEQHHSQLILTLMPQNYWEVLFFVIWWTGFGASVRVHSVSGETRNQTDTKHLEVTKHLKTCS